MIITDAVIRLSSLFKPGVPMIVEGAHYRGCVFEGPANVVFQGNCALDHTHFSDADLVVLAKSVAVKLNTAVMFRECTFENCRFDRVCVLLFPNDAATLNSPTANWITDPPDTDSSALTQRTEGMSVQ